jgi:hypothetical protein
VVDRTVFDEYVPELDDSIYWLGSSIYFDGDKIKVKDYDTLYEDENGDLYDFRGFATTEGFQKKANNIWNNENLTEEEKQAAVQEIAANYELTFTKKDLKIDKYPTNGEIDDIQDWWNKWGWVIAGYTPHKHKLSYWYSDGTTHWRECLVCEENFIGQNWCQDGDEDRICNICGGDVPYHDITAEGPDGYTVTLNRDNASHRTKITAKVEAPAGAQYKLHFIKVRTDGSEQEITRYKKNGEFYTHMPTYPLKVVIETIK